jgi:hypothetical protein
MGLRLKRRRARNAPKSRSAMKLSTEAAEMAAIASAFRPESAAAAEEAVGKLLVFVVEEGEVVEEADAEEMELVLVMVEEGEAEDCVPVAECELLRRELVVRETEELVVSVEELRVLVRVLVRVEKVAQERVFIVVSEVIVLLVTTAVWGTTAGGAAFVAIGTKLPPYLVL